MDLVRKGYKSIIHVEEDVLVKERMVNKMAIYHKTDILKIADDMIQRWSDRMYCTLAGEIWLDFLNRDASKGNAIRSIQETLGISPEETMVFGDNFNDIKMFHSAKESYAVGNAVEAVKKEAKYVTDTNVNDGVLKVLKTLL